MVPEQGPPREPPAKRESTDSSQDKSDSRSSDEDTEGSASRHSSQKETVKDEEATAAENPQVGTNAPPLEPMKKRKASNLRTSARQRGLPPDESLQFTVPKATHGASSTSSFTTGSPNAEGKALPAPRELGTVQTSTHENEEKRGDDRAQVKRLEGGMNRLQVSKRKQAAEGGPGSRTGTTVQSIEAEVTEKQRLRRAKQEYPPRHDVSSHPVSAALDMKKEAPEAERVPPGSEHKVPELGIDNKHSMDGRNLISSTSTEQKQVVLNRLMGYFHSAFSSCPPKRSTIPIPEPDDDVDDVDDGSSTTGSLVSEEVPEERAPDKEGSNTSASAPRGNRWYDAVHDAAKAAKPSQDIQPLPPPVEQPVTRSAARSPRNVFLMARKKKRDAPNAAPSPTSQPQGRRDGVEASRDSTGGGLAVSDVLRADEVVNSAGGGSTGTHGLPSRRGVTSWSQQVSSPRSPAVHNTTVREDGNDQDFRRRRSQHRSAVQLPEPISSPSSALYSLPGSHSPLASQPNAGGYSAGQPQIPNMFSHGAVSMPASQRLPPSAAGPPPASTPRGSISAQRPAMQMMNTRNATFGSRPPQPPPPPPAAAAPPNPVARPAARAALLFARAAPAPAPAPAAPAPFSVAREPAFPRHQQSMQRQFHGQPSTTPGPPGTENALFSGSADNDLALNFDFDEFIEAGRSEPTPGISEQSYVAYEQSIPGEGSKSHDSGSYSEQSNSRDNASSTTQSRSNKTLAKSSKSLGKRLAADDNGEDDEADDNHRRRKRSHTDGAEGQNQQHKRFACPFFKRNPRKYREERSCVGPGWRTVHRLKEHLYRSHMLGIHCFRCHKAFQTDHQLQLHMRADPPCQVKDMEVLEGIDGTQERALRSRKKIQKDMTEEDKWREAYKIIFPADDHANMPSPYYDMEGRMDDLEGTDQSSELARYEEFLRRELPPRVKHELESRIDEALFPVEETLRGQLVDIVRDLQLHLFEAYKKSRASEKEDGSQGPSSTVATEPATTEPPTSESAGSQTNPTPDWSLDEQLEPFRPLPDFDTNFGGFDGLLFDFTQVPSGQSWPDSGYGSVFPDDKTQPSMGGGQGVADLSNFQSTSDQQVYWMGQ